jgi:hypothetical protein
VTRGIDRVNRFVLTLLGLLVLAAGAVTLLLAAGVFGERRSERPLLQDNYRDFADRNAGWFWLVVAAVAAVVALLALRWLLAQLSTARVGSLPLERDRREGETVLRSGAVADAVEQEIEGFRGVSKASARLTGDRYRPDLELSVGLSGTADLGQVRQRIEQRAVAHVRQAVGIPDLPVRVQLSVTPESGREVR